MSAAQLKLRGSPGAVARRCFGWIAHPGASRDCLRIAIRAVAGGLFLLPGTSFAARFEGSELGLLWGVPFAGILVSIALWPLVAPRFWHAHFGKVALGWSLLFVVPFMARFGLADVLHQLAHAILLEYLPFVTLLFALYTVAGGLCVTYRLRGSPLVNTAFLGVGAFLASIMGTTGAAMLLIRPLLRANLHRTHKIHLVVFFIFLVANVGGALSPLGDPPLFLGFLNGVPFFWTTEALFWPTVTLVGLLLVMFFVIDCWQGRRDESARPSGEPPENPYPNEMGPGGNANPPAPVIGIVNFVFLGAIIGTVLMSGLWKTATTFTVLGTPLELPNLVRDALLIAISLLSLRVTPAQAYRLNAFHWGPMIEVAKLFLGIFVTIVPVIAILQSGDDGALAFLTQIVTRRDGAPHEGFYFWLTGGLSAFLDNAPTYLVFFNLAGGDAVQLAMQRTVLAAISSGAVFMGALTYIGNAPNFMVKAIAEDAGVRMPSFFGYMAWSGLLLLPLLAAIHLLFFV